jgi:hypothetical protein
MIAVDGRGRKLRDIPAPEWSEERFADPQQYRAYLESVPAYRSLSGATVYRRECVVEIGGFPDDLGHWADTFAIQAIALKHGAVYVPEIFMAWRKLSTSFSHDSQRRLRRNLGIITSSAALMRSSRFRDRFPEAYVRRWARGYRVAAVLTYLRALARGSCASAKDAMRRRAA